MNVESDLHTLVQSYKSVQIVFNVHNPVKLKILTVNPYNSILNLFYAKFITLSV